MRPYARTHSYRALPRVTRVNQSSTHTLQSYKPEQYRHTQREALNSVEGALAVLSPTSLCPLEPVLSFLRMVSPKNPLWD